MAQENPGRRFEGYQVYDRHYEKVGKVDDLFVDKNDNPEYIGVKTGLFGGPSTLIPMAIVRVNDARGLIEVASDKETIKDAPSFDDDEDITAGFEDGVYAHFGATREAPSADMGGYGAYYGGDPDVDLVYGERSSGSGTVRESPPEYEHPPRDREAAYPSSSANEESLYAETRPNAEPRETEAGRVYDWDTEKTERRETGGRQGGAGTTGSGSAGVVGAGMSTGDTESGEIREHHRNQEGVSQLGSDPKDELRVQRSEEELRAGTRERDAGHVKVRKRVRMDRERIEVPTRREEVSVKRVPVSGKASEARIGEDEVSVPVVEDEVVVQKRAVAKEEIRVRKDVVEDTEVVEGDVRREEVEIVDDTRWRGQ
jgi:uncharacterized protein (TIGR02271 family)